MSRRARILDAVTARLGPALSLSAVLLMPATAPIAQAAGVDGTSIPKPTLMSEALLEGLPTGPGASIVHVQGDVRAPVGSDGVGVLDGLFRVDTGATETIAPASALESIGIVPVGVADYERPDGTVEQYSFGLVQIEFLGEMREGRVLFGPEDVEPAIGLSALEAIGLAVDPETSTLHRVTAEQ